MRQPRILWSHGAFLAAVIAAYVFLPAAPWFRICCVITAIHTIVQCIGHYTRGADWVWPGPSMRLQRIYTVLLIGVVCVGPLLEMADVLPQPIPIVVGLFMVVALIPFGRLLMHHEQRDRAVRQQPHDPLPPSGGDGLSVR